MVIYLSLIHIYKGMVKVGLGALEVMVTLPLAFAADCGVKVTLKLALCPAVSVTGAVIHSR